jgi:acyl-coenzyme A synthetase/AMP-(fatty) acid ligase
MHFYGMQFRLLWPLSAGRVFDGVTCSTPEMVLERLQCFSEAFFVSSPAMLSRLPELMPLASLLPRPRMILSSGGPLPRSAAHAFHTQLGQAPSEIFGSTESGAIAWRRQEADDAWTPLPGVSVGVDDDTALVLTSPFMADASAWRMDDGVDQLPDGRFRLLGRLDRTVKIEEKRLSLPDLEGRLAAHPWVGAAAAVVLPGRRQRLGVALVASAAGREVMRAQGRRAATEELRSHLADYFDPVLVPRHWRFVDSLPVNERGKLTQAAVAALFKAMDDVAVAA